MLSIALTMLLLVAETPVTSDIAGLINANDYPAEALKANESGTVVALFNVAGDGRPIDCRIKESSRSASLDAATCRIFMERAHFTKTAIRHRGKPFTVRVPIKWLLEVEPYETWASFSRLTIPINRAGTPTACRYEVFWFGKPVKDEDCVGDPEMAALVAKSSKGRPFRNRYLVNEVHVIPGAIVPRLGKGKREKLLVRTLAEIEVGRDGKAASCDVIEDNTDGGVDHCAIVMEQDLGFGEPPKDKPLLKVRQLNVIYTRPWRDRRTSTR